ncbi:hypothetical protein KGQ25_02050 [Patescibacteria group bacterium]|nr:hypothetical protein [Patescibacteria group bacterium]
MDEILIEEKKYVSSKRAAKITGYAKDYIGQLCREGRVPARLVGRSWYVLEAAIQDHRFGNPADESVENVKATKPSIQSTWEHPRYESTSAEPLPSLNRLSALERPGNKDKEEREHGETSGDTPPQRLQDSWQAWFSRMADAAGKPTDDPVATVPVKQEESISEEGEETQEQQEGDEEEVSVPIHAIYEPLLGKMPPHINEEYPREQEDQYQPVRKEVRKEKSGLFIKTLTLIGVLFAAVAVTVAVLGSGYLDKYSISFKQARIISGISVYNK